MEQIGQILKTQNTSRSQNEASEQTNVRKKLSVRPRYHGWGENIFGLDIAAKNFVVNFIDVVNYY